MQMKTHANGFQRATMGTLVHLFAIYLYHVNGCRIAIMHTTATCRARRERKENRMCAEVVRRLLADFLYHALHLIIYIGYEIGIAQHFDVVVKAEHKAANA